MSLFSDVFHKAVAPIESRLRESFCLLAYQDFSLNCRETENMF